MSNNRSVVKFKTDMQLLRNRMRYAIHERTLRVAEEVAENMRQAAPKFEGRLAASVRVVDNTRGTSGAGVAHQVSVKIKGGGPLTTRRSANGRIYDYASAIEFGNERAVAQPFFYPTWRRYTAGNSAARKIAESAKEALRANKDIVDRRVDPSLGSSRHSGVVTRRQYD